MLDRSPRRSDSTFRDYVGGDSVNIVVLSQRGPRIRKILLLTVVLASIFKVSLLATVIRHAQSESVRMRTYGRLSQLRLALANYEYAYGGLPPRQQTDRGGNVHFNWLVAVLPQIEYGDLHAALDLSSRWDSSHNLDVARSDELFLDFITRDGYTACPLNGEESIWNPLTGFPIGTLTESPGSIALIAVPIDRTRTDVSSMVTLPRVLGDVCRYGRKMIELDETIGIH